MKKIIHFIFGTIIGSFLAVVCSRIPKGESLLSPPSHCEHCGHTLRPVELVPLVSAVCLRFRCTQCHQPFPARSFWIELGCGILFAIFLPNFQWGALWQLFWLLSTLVLAVIDWDYLIVEMRIFYCTGGLLLLSGAYLFHLNWLHPLIIGALFYLSQKILPNSLGLGDLWVIGLWSFFLSGYELLQILFIASFSGLAFFALEAFRKKKPKQLPFLPFLFIGLLFLLIKKH